MKRTRKRRTDNRPNPLKTAITALGDAVDDLCAPRAQQQIGGGVAWAPSRYAELAAAIDITASRSGAGTGTGRIPCWIDPLMLKMRIDARVVTATGTHAATPRLLRGLTKARWRPQDIDRLEALTAEIGGWVKAIDDLFAPKPIYLPDPCPQCGQTHTYRWADDGQRIRTAALALAADDRGAWCQSCHVKWTPPAGLFLLGRMLAAQAETLPA